MINIRVEAYIFNYMKEQTTILSLLGSGSLCAHAISFTNVAIGLCNNLVNWRTLIISELLTSTNSMFTDVQCKRVSET